MWSTENIVIAWITLLLSFPVIRGLAYLTFFKIDFLYNFFFLIKRERSIKPPKLEGLGKLIQQKPLNICLKPDMDYLHSSL